MQIILKNGDILEMPEAHYMDGNHFYTEKNGKWIASIVDGNVVSVSSKNKIIRADQDILQRALNYMDSKNQFGWQEQMTLDKLKKKMSNYMKRSGTFKY